MVEVVVRRERSPLRCPYCHEEIEGEPGVACGPCGASQHAECAAEHGRCASCGAGDRGAAGPTAAGPIPAGLDGLAAVVAALVGGAVTALAGLVEVVAWTLSELVAALQGGAGSAASAPRDLDLPPTADDLAVPTALAVPDALAAPATGTAADPPAGTRRRRWRFRPGPMLRVGAPLLGRRRRRRR